MWQCGHTIYRRSCEYHVCIDKSRPIMIISSFPSDFSKDQSRYQFYPEKMSDTSSIFAMVHGDPWRSPPLDDPSPRWRGCFGRVAPSWSSPTGHRPSDWWRVTWGGLWVYQWDLQMAIGGVPEMGVSAVSQQLDGIQWKIRLKGMIWGCPCSGNTHS